LRDVALEYAFLFKVLGIAWGTWRGAPVMVPDTGSRHNTDPCRSCRRLRSFDLEISKSKDRSLRQLLHGCAV